MKWLQSLFNIARKTPESSTTLHRAPDGLYTLRVSGVLSRAALDRAQMIAAHDIKDGAMDLRVLVILTHFRGWRKGDAWDDIGFFAQYDRHIARIAVVGDAQWERESLVFLAAGYRRGEVRYFPPDRESEARAWLAG